MPLKNTPITFLKSRPAFLFLFPLFFVLHGYNRNYNSIPAGDAGVLVLSYIGISLMITGIAWLFFRNMLKAAIIATLVMAFHFFFGNIQDMLSEISGQGFISKYRFILPAAVLVLILAVVSVKKMPMSLLSKIITYFNILFGALILIDLGSFIIKSGNDRTKFSQNNFLIDAAIPVNSNKPDIYLILLDQYAGSSALKQSFHFDNTSFENELGTRGFHIVKDSKSNYNLTPFSMASLLSMNYLGPEAGQKKNLNVGYSYNVIRNSCAIEFLQKNGYQFYNYSLFDFPSNAAYKYKDFLPYGTKLITASTFTGRLVRDLRSSILEGKLGSKPMREKVAYEYLHFNDTILKWTNDVTMNHNDKPKFIYAHLMMPHFPYYFDSLGKPLPIEKLSSFKKNDAGDYIGYLKYSNEKILQLVDHILVNSPNPPVIMLLSDHGFRNPDRKMDRKFDFMNLNAVFIPGKNYKLFYDSMSNVNQFRILFNSCFEMRLQLLTDSTTDLWD